MRKDDAFATSLIHDPMAIVHIPIGVVKLADAVELAIGHLAFVKCSVLKAELPYSILAIAGETLSAEGGEIET